MNCFESTGRVQRMMQSRTSTEYLFEDTGPWKPCVGVNAVRAAMQIYGAATTDFQGILAVQTASVRPELPDAWSTLGLAVLSGAEPLTGSGYVWTGAGDKMWFRIGVGHKYSSGSPAEASVTIDGAWNACGRIVDASSFELFTLTAGKVSYVTLTDWIPAIGVDAVMAAVEITSVLKTSGALKWCLTYQKADAEIENPGAWSFISKTYAETDTSVNTGEMALATELASTMFVRFGIQHEQQTSGTTRADFNVTIAVRHDPLLALLSQPADWGSDDGGSPGPTIGNTRATYVGNCSASNKFCGVYQYEADYTFTITAYGGTSGDPSGPGAWNGTTGYAWLGYDTAAGAWKVYTAASLTTTPTASGSVSGVPYAITRVTAVNTPTPSCKFEVSFDGTTYTQVHSIAQAFSYRYYVVMKNATYNLKRATIA